MVFFVLNSVIEWNRKPLLVQLHFNWKLIRKISTISIGIDEFSLQYAYFMGFWNQNATLLLLLIAECPNRPQITIEMWRFWYKWGVSRVCTTSSSGYMVISLFPSKLLRPLSIGKRRYPKIQWRWPPKPLKKNQCAIHSDGQRWAKGQFLIRKKWHYETP